jgi:uncharacterized cupredoxin-like copper-binding protein
MATGARIPTPPGRYGTPSRGRRLALIAAVVSIVVLFLAWLAWAAWHHARTSVSGDVTSFSVVSSHEIDVTVSVQRPSGDLVVCTVEVRASDHELVAAQDITVPAGQSGSVQVKATIRTDREATSADVTGCRD